MFRSLHSKFVIYFHPAIIQIYTQDLKIVTSKWKLKIFENSVVKYTGTNFIKNSFRVVVPKLCSADPKGSATSSQGIRGYIFVMTTLKITYTVITRMVLLKIIVHFL